MEKKYAEAICPFCSRNVDDEFENFDEVKECSCGALYTQELANEFWEEESQRDFADILEIEELKNIEIKVIENFDISTEEGAEEGDEVYLVFGKIKK